MKKSHKIFAIIGVLASIAAIAQLIWYYKESIMASPIGRRLFGRFNDIDDFDDFDEDDDYCMEIDIVPEGSEDYEGKHEPFEEHHSKEAHKDRRGYVTLDLTPTA